MPTHPSNQFNLSPDQKQVLVAIAEWLKHPTGGYLTVGGYAGTGKTSLSAVLRILLKKHQPKLKIAFATFTGKATQVLKSTLHQFGAVFEDDSVSTLHSLMYRPETDSAGRVANWVKLKQLKYDLIIVDEASMVTSELWHDLVSYRVPIIAIGDHGQLPPVGDDFNLMAEPDVVLQKIHRQAAGNPILKVAELARTHGQIPVQEFGPGVVKLNGLDDSTSDQVDQLLYQRHPSQLVLVGFNKTRIRLNKHVRFLRGFEADQPLPGETVICLRNNYQLASPIFNGLIGTISTLNHKEPHWYQAEIQFTDQNQLYSGLISKHQFHQPSLVQQVDELEPTQIGDRFDFGYALTVHKAQGSQAKRVLVFEEKHPAWDDETWQRWLYTAVTRAEKELVVVGR